MKPKDPVIRARCSLELKERVRAYVKRYSRNGFKESDLVRLALEEYLKEHENQPDLTIQAAGSEPGHRHNSKSLKGFQ